ncbi:MAG TPA: hypothetical protein VMW69_05325 [Spirochaetia bacterium]|nr:hypothetical protein [Spirochaetia bacterium]
MSFAHLLILGAIAGLTIFLGLPVAALNRIGAKAKSVLTGIAIGILLFLAVEILSKVLEAGQQTLLGATKGQLTTGYASLTLALLVVGILSGLLGIPLIERGIIKPLTSRKTPPDGRTAPSPTSLSLAIASGIGLHNFGEGLAIGQSAATGAISLAVLLIVGFGLHNMTEGFGVAAPLTGTKPSGLFLVGAGLIAGGPTFVGTLVGSIWTSNLAMVIFLSIAGGSLVYVTLELLAIGRNSLAKLPLLASIAGGFMVGYLTDLITGVAGA